MAGKMMSPTARMSMTPATAPNTVLMSRVTTRPVLSCFPGLSAFSPHTKSLKFLGTEDNPIGPLAGGFYNFPVYYNMLGGIDRARPARLSRHKSFAEL